MGDVAARADFSWHELIRGAYLARIPNGMPPNPWIQDNFQKTIGFASNRFRASGLHCLLPNGGMSANGSPGELVWAASRGFDRSQKRPTSGSRFHLLSSFPTSVPSAAPRSVAHSRSDRGQSKSRTGP